MLTDAELLRRFVTSRSEAAFAELVHRHLNHVYSVALRQVGGDRHLAQDVSQLVFVALAQKAAQLQHLPVLGGWLHRTTQYTAIDLVRSEQRRRRREQEAHAMPNPSPPEAAAGHLRPILDRVIAELDPGDRDAIWLRFFEQRSFGEVGRRLGLAENAARMRVHRALDKLQAGLARRGVTSSAAAVGLALAHQPMVSAPAGLAASITSAALSSILATPTASTAFFMGLSKLQLSLAGVLCAGAFTAVALHSRTNTISTPASPPAAAVAAVADAPRALPEPAAMAAPRDTATPPAGAVREPATAGGSAPAISPAALTDRLPVVRTQPALPYPDALRRAGTTGAVLVEFIVDSSGTVREPVVAQSTQSELDALALAAVAAWEFDSGVKGGRAVHTRMQVTILFDPTQPEAVVSEPEPRNQEPPRRS